MAPNSSEYKNKTEQKHRQEKVQINKGLLSLIHTT
jgi:hypothetical protein